MRLNLNYNWKYSETFHEEHINKDFDDNDFNTVNIPHANKEIPYNNFDEEMYQFVSCYRKLFYVPDTFAGKRLILEFEAVANYAEVYVNGSFAFSHKGGFTAFNGDVTDFIKVGEDNLIVVKVDSTERSDIPPFGNVVDYLCYGGIYREVYLYAYNDTYITQLLVAPKDALKTPKIELKLKFNKKATENAFVTVTDSNGETVKEFEINTLGSDYLEITENIDNIKLWNIDNPVLYSVNISYNGDNFTDKFGFREVRFTKKGFYLNGKNLKIRGLNRHQSYPYVGYAMPKEAQIADADYLKYGLGLNLVRTSHYPNSKHFLNRCDEIGLLVFTEIPGWQYVGKDEEWRKVCLQHVEEMIIQDYNHPSIVLWGVRINESGDDRELYTATNALAHKLDSTRQTGGVRCFPRSELLEDVYTYNDFNHNGENGALMPKIIVCGIKPPLLITEHNGHMFPTKTFDHEKKRQEHALRHAKVLDAAYKRKNTCGAIGWCMSDYNTHKDFGSGDKICYHGVSDMFRMDKLAAFVYKSQQDDYPVLELTSNMEIGDNAGGQVGKVYMITNCDKVNLYKSGKLINTFDIKAMAEKSEFKHLPHPPVEMYDIIGTQIEETGRFTKHAADKLKQFLLNVKMYGTFPAIFRMPHTLLALMLKYKLTIDEITSLFGQYVTNWGDKSVSYKLEGIKGDKSVVIEKASVQTASLTAVADSTNLIEEDTYSVTRIAIKAISQTGSVLPYSNDTIKISVEGPISVIGDSNISLIGGQRAVWIKTEGHSGKAKVVLDSVIGHIEIPITVKKSEVTL